MDENVFRKDTDVIENTLINQRHFPYYLPPPPHTSCFVSVVVILFFRLENDLVNLFHKE